jgi:hypothetical protein
MLRTTIHLRVVFNICVATRDVSFNRVLAPEGEILFFARAKKSIQKKARPDAACFLRSVIFVGLCQSAASLPRPFGLFPTKTPVLGATYGN